jgi:hypothetical protein
MSKAVPLYPKTIPATAKTVPGRKILSPRRQKLSPGRKILSPVCHRFSESIRGIQKRDKFLYQELDANRSKLRELMLAESRFRPGQTVRHRRDQIVGRVVRVDAPGFAEGDAELGLYVHERLPSGRFSRKETWWFGYHVDVVDPEKAPQRKRARAAA